MTEFALSWLRPWWLIAYLPLLLCALVWWKSRRGRSDWTQVVDVALQPYVLESEADRSSFSPFALFFTWALVIAMLAGPVWEKTEVPVFEAHPAVVALLDLSPSMRVDDVKPDRLSRAKFKLEDFLSLGEDLQVGLIAFSERPYVISPLTDDITTVTAFLPSLVPEIMPVQGSRVDLAIDRAVSLLEQATVMNGSIVLITDSQIGQRDIDAASVAQSKGFTVSVLGVGTESGAPLRAPGGQFVKDGSGAIVVPQLKLNQLQNLTDAGGGSTVSMSSGKQDINALVDLVSGARIERAENSSGQPIAEYWIERTPWLLPLLAFVSLLLFRRGLA